MTNENCTCGHVYDEHDDGQECQVQIRDRAPDGSEVYRQCMCVYFEEAAGDE